MQKIEGQIFRTVNNHFNTKFAKTSKIQNKFRDILIIQYYLYNIILKWHPLSDT